VSILVCFDFVILPNLPIQITNEKMKNRILIFIAFMAVCKTAFPQITLTVNDIANVGDQVITSNVPYTGEAPATGTNQTYDLSSLLPGFMEDTTKYIAAAGTPFASQMPGANLCQTSPLSQLQF
jgi:hypothetical protein